MTVRLSRSTVDRENLLAPSLPQLAPGIGILFVVAVIIAVAFAGVRIGPRPAQRTSSKRPSRLSRGGRECVNLKSLIRR